MRKVTGKGDGTASSTEDRPSVRVLNRQLMYHDIYQWYLDLSRIGDEWKSKALFYCSIARRSRADL